MIPIDFQVKWSKVKVKTYGLCSKGCPLNIILPLCFKETCSLLRTMVATWKQMIPTESQGQTAGPFPKCAYQ